MILYVYSVTVDEKAGFYKLLNVVVAANRDRILLRLRLKHAPRERSTGRTLFVRRLSEIGIVIRSYIETTSAVKGFRLII